MIPLPPVLDHLGHGAPAGRDHRRPARHRLDHHQPERLLPLDREERRARVLEQLDLLAVRDLAEVLDLGRTRCGRTNSSKYCCSSGSRLLAGDLQRQPGRDRDVDRAVAALVRAHPPEEEQVVAAVRLAPGRARSRARSGSSRPTGGRGFGLRWFIEIEMKPISGATCGDLLVDRAALAVERPVDRVQRPACRSAPPIAAAGSPEWSLITSNSSARA